jgi:DUF4097 and DUF4098 domain-containing protein YvlB
MVGALLLIDRLAPGVELGYWITHYWPVLIILWGVAKLIDRLAFVNTRAAPPAFNPTTGAALPTAARPPLLTGGEFTLIVSLVLIVFGAFLHGWLRQVLPRGVAAISPFTESATQTQHASATAIPPGSKITVNTAIGDVSIHPGTGSDLLVSAGETAHAETQSAAQTALQRVQLAAERTADGYAVHPVNGNHDDLSVDLDVMTPPNAAIVARTEQGDVHISGAPGNAEASVGSGDTTIRNAAGDVNVDGGPGDTRIDSVGGAVHFRKHGHGDVEVSNVKGDATIEEGALGDVKIRNVAKSVQLTSSRTTVSIAALPGELTLDSGDINISRARGPVTISAHDQDVTANDIDGAFDLTAQHGDVEITYSQPPKGSINITTDSGDVSLTLPAGSSFTLSAVSKSGDVDNDFSGGRDDDGDGGHSVSANYGSGGPQIRITTRYGDIHIRKN